ncbi:hypothetical protein PoB_007167000 [Plakobranchus ocellatus]|uniref:Uncharacterized protein n=1 Tax=Plakobranchus ocellatus TaxID=259542 RepID=A0AAV4DM91_9GAST|nr:hypothetical protein PoB_007167000 [Plakobranchus ocellatus]
MERRGERRKPGVAMATHDALRRSLKFKLKLILSENKILIQTIEEHVKKAEAIYRDTEALEKIPTKVFKKAMARLETAYSSCIKLILLASDLFGKVIN